MNYRLIEIGRRKVTREINIKEEKEIIKEAKKHLASFDVEVVGTADAKGLVKGNIYAGFQLVGRVERIEA
jgi:hypothetical protein